MHAFRIHAVFSGETDSEHWVTLRFASDGSEDDVIHVVCGLDVDEQDAALGMDRLYLERDDQSRGGYGGADAVEVAATSVRIHLNERGLRTLEFDESLDLHWTDTIEGKADAVDRFMKMREYPWGRIVRIV
ncbi:Imm10 family immunity protein [Luteimonas aquatica]|uniref:Imm10 family immunity protein n=1 Tax=Luteimonas aquatica TaxID=450364 RepID=UPI001F5A3E3C|nr:Imm10 family immunity protein [Luteimonas aquatica]